MTDPGSAPAPTTTAAPTYLGLRAAGFVGVAVGALVAGLGALLDWVQVGLRGFSASVITPTQLGVDRLEGRVVLALAIVALVTALIARLGRTRSRRWAGIVALVAGLGIVATCALTIALGTDRYEREAVAEIRALPTASRPSDDLVAAIAELTQARLLAGVWIGLTGGVLIAAGGALTTTWSARVRRDDVRA